MGANFGKHNTSERDKLTASTGLKKNNRLHSRRFSDFFSKMLFKQPRATSAYFSSICISSSSQTNSQIHLAMTNPRVTPQCGSSTGGDTHAGVGELQALRHPVDDLALEVAERCGELVRGAVRRQGTNARAWQSFILGGKNELKKKCPSPRSSC